MTRSLVEISPDADLVVKTSRHGCQHHSCVIVPLLAWLVGLCIGDVDTRPHWDDAGITAGALFLFGLVFGALRPRSVTS